MFRELWQNASDTDATEITITVTPLAGVAAVEFEVRDNAPAGFRDLSLAYRIFARSDKANDPEKSGQFCLGEKLVITVCEWSQIITTTGCLEFTPGKGRRRTRARTERGTSVRGTMRMTRAEVAEVEAHVQSFLPRPGQVTVFNGQPLPERPAVASFEAVLPMRAREAGRKTVVTLHELLPGETAHLYELGAPVVELDGGEPYHVNVHQKVPVNLDRDNVPPSYRRALRAAVLNAIHGKLAPADATADWAREAAADTRCSAAAITTVLGLRFGERRVSFDPSDIEGSHLAVARGFNLVHAGSMSPGEWRNARAAGAILPAGKVTPSPRAFDPDGAPLQTLPREAWSAQVARRAVFAQVLGRELLDATVEVVIASDPDWPHVAAYGPRAGGASGQLVLNLAHLGEAWFARAHSDVEVTELLLHEFAHHLERNHLSSKYHDATCTLGGRLALVALAMPTAFAA